MNEGVTTISYTLDEGLIEFGTAVDDGDFPRLVTHFDVFYSLRTSSPFEGVARRHARAARERRRDFAFSRGSPRWP